MDLSQEQVSMILSLQDGLKKEGEDWYHEHTPNS